ncbi:MAG: dihydroorotate dehydrogenase electron transfer subunit [Candidatus Micrarchaeota archaeon]|nr:dihydroorotate dehydrogenase electron transfer subunit [Candidatus Micrarchaeota archaeon]
MLPKIATIKSVEKENDIVTTFTLDVKLPAAKPGQFIMAWLPGFEDEKPFSLAGAVPLVISVGARGKFSRALCNLKAGQKIWYRGPYGRGFELPKKGKRILLVGGGYGFAPLRYIAAVAKKKGISATAICGARSKGLLMKPATCKTIFTTDDGSAGMKGNVLVAAEELLKKEKFDMVYTCGPEKMMGAVARLAEKHKTVCQILTERYMKCGIGVCGHCCMGDKIVCWDGPMFYWGELKDNTEFEKVWRDRTGRAVKL